MKKNYFLLLGALCLSIAATYSQALYINEIMATNSRTLADATGGYEDWIELYNPGPTPVNIANFYLTDSKNNPTRHRIMPGTSSTVVPAQGFLLIWASGVESRGNLHLPFRLSADGEYLALYADDGTTLIDSLSFGPQRTDVSWGRKPNGTADWFYFKPATPNASNNASTGYTALLDPPTFSHQAGFYTSDLSLSLQAPAPGATILYTLDGSDPDPANLAGTTFIYKNQYPRDPGQGVGPNLLETLQTYAYTNPITLTNRANQPNKVSVKSSTFDYTPYYFPSALINKATVVRAIAYQEGTLPSAIITNTYFINPAGRPRYSLPVISLSTSEKKLFDYNTGIYTAGKDFVDWRNAFPNESVGKQSGGNYWRESDYRYPMHFEFFEPTSEPTSARAHRQDMGFQIHGGFSRTNPRKSIRLYADSDFGDNELAYPIFPRLPYTSYKRLILRDGGTDWAKALFRDAFAQDLVRSLRFDIQDNRPSIVFLNGEYWGIHNIRDRHDRFYLERVYGVSRDSVDMLVLDREVEEGSSAKYTELINYVNANNPLNAGNYAHVQTLMDTDNFVDYTVAEIFSGNSDWPFNNIRYWRKQTTGYLPNAPYGHDGRWRWMMYDVDYSFGFGIFNKASYNTLEYATASNETLPPPWSTLLLRRLLANETFRNSFITRFADLLNTIFQASHTSALLTTYQQAFQPEMNEHVARWNNNPSLTDWNNELTEMFTFSQQRPAHMRNHLRAKFGLSSDRNLTIQISNAAHGHVRVNTIDLLPTTPGVSATPYPWTGVYFQQVPVVLRARAVQGYRFARWQEGANTVSTDTVYSVTLAASRTLQAVFEVDPNFSPIPAPYTFSDCAYEFSGWPADTTAGVFPTHMAFVYMNQPDPPLTAEIEGFTSGVYNFETRSRINGLGEDGIAFINTTSDTPSNFNDGYPMGRMGGALLGLNTLGQNAAYVSWTGGTVLPNNREYAIRLQYRVGDSGPFLDLLDEQGQVVEYVRNPTAGHSQRFGPTALPANALNQPYVQLLWRYYLRTPGSSNRAQLRLDDIVVSRGTCESLASGDWNSTSTWSCGRVPTLCDEVVLRPGHIVTLTTPENYAKTLHIEEDSQLVYLENNTLQLGY